MTYVEIYEKYVEDHIQVFPQHKNRASSAGHPCERHLVYCRLNTGERLKTDLGLELIFREGNHQEKSFVRDFTDAGIYIQESQRAFEWPEYELTGRIDGVITNGDRFPIEFKSMNPFTFEKIFTAEDLKTSYTYYIRGYYAQMQLYLLMNNSERGIVFLKNKVTGRIKQIDLAIDYEYAEGILKKLESVNAHVKAKRYPERMTDRSPCGSCGFRHLCLPDEAAESINIEEDSELIELLEERELLKASAKNYEALDEKVKNICKAKTDGNYLVNGKFQIKISTYDRKFVNIPPELKDKYQETKPATRINITMLK